MIFRAGYFVGIKQTVQMPVQFLIYFTAILTIAQLTNADSQQISAKVAFRGSRHVEPTEKGVGCQTNDDKDEFPVPPASLPNLVEKARLFARTYFTEEELAELRHRLDEIRRTGGDRQKIRQAVQEFVNEVLDDARKLRIQEKKNELDRQFGTYV